MMLYDDLSVRNQMYSDIITTAVEGGIGYWAVCRNYRWCRDGVEIAASVEVREHHCWADEDFYGEDGPRFEKVTIKEIAKAVLALSRGEGWHSDGTPPTWWLKKWKAAYKEIGRGDWDYDAADADIIVQVAALGGVTYG